MSEARYPSKERVERDGYLVYAEGDDLAGDPEEAKRQGYKLDEPKADKSGADKADAPASNKARRK